MMRRSRRLSPVLARLCGSMQMLVRGETALLRKHGQDAVVQPVDALHDEHVRLPQTDDLSGLLVSGDEVVARRDDLLAR